MKKIFKALNYSVALSFLLALFISCDKDYSSIESDVLSENNFNFDTENLEIPIKTYNKNLEAQQINGLTSNLLGYFKDPIYGETTASIVTQVVPASFATNTSEMFGVNPVIDSVILTIPYFSTQIGITGDIPEYKLDSLFVENNNPENIEPIRLVVYENTYFLRSFNIDDPNSQNYFSKADASINNTDNFAQTESTTINFDEYVGQLFCDTLFTITTAPREIKTGSGNNEVTSYLPPALQLKLATSDISKARWKSLILNQAGSPTLSSANDFYNHFRGLYLKASAVNNNGSLVLLNLLDSGANITIYYSSDDNNQDNERELGNYTLNFNGNRLNTFINNYNILPTTPDTTNGDETLFLKGTEGSMAVIELFSGLVDCDGDGQVNDDALECFKKTFRKTDTNGNILDPVNEQYELKRLINEAHLVIYEDESIIIPNDPNTLDPNGNDYHAFNRLYVYNLESNTPIQDYNSDFSAEASNPLISRRFSLGSRVIDDEGNAKYKLKVTDLLNNILVRDIDVTKLGLILTNNVNINISTDLLNSADDVTGIPSTAIITPRGTVLHGSNSNNDDKKLRLDVFFTEAK